MSDQAGKGSDQEPQMHRGGLREGHMLARNESMFADGDEARDRFDAATEKEVPSSAKPGMLERVKRWFSAKF